MGAHTKGKRASGEAQGEREAEGRREREGENKIVQLHSKHYFSFFNKRFHGVVDARQVQLTATNAGITLRQSQARL